MIEDLTGTWKVRIKKGSRFLRLLNLIGDKKIITGMRGHNVAAGFWPWGAFTIQPGKSGKWEFVYSDGKILDEVSVVYEDKICGTFYYRENKDSAFQERGRFVMTRVV